MVGEKAASQVRRALEEGPFGLNRLASEAGLSYDVLRSWKSGRRRPSEQGIRRLIGGLEQRSERLADLAAGLHTALEEEQGEGRERSVEAESSAAG